MIKVKRFLSTKDFEHIYNLEHELINLNKLDDYSVIEMQNFYNKNDITFIVFEDENSREIIGFFSAFPLYSEYHTHRITTEDVVSQYLGTRKDRPIDLYIRSFIIDKEKCKTLGIKNPLFEIIPGIINFWKNRLSDNGYVIKHIVAHPVNSDGEKLCKLFNLTKSNDCYSINLFKHKNYKKFSRFERNSKNTPIIFRRTIEEIYENYFYKMRITVKIKQFCKAFFEYIKNHKTIRKNRKLVKKYPFLDVYRSMYLEDKPSDFDSWLDYKFGHYTTTFLDSLPDSWRNAFGIKMCDELKAELIKHNFLDKYYVVQVKEKYGTLRWYDSGHPSGSNIEDIISKYEDYSMTICIKCGKPATHVSTGWISYQCADCLRKEGYNDEDLEKCKLTWDDIPKRIYNSGDESCLLISDIDFKSIWPEK